MPDHHLGRLNERFGGDGCGTHRRFVPGVEHPPRGGEPCIGVEHGPRHDGGSLPERIYLVGWPHGHPFGFRAERADLGVRVEMPVKDCGEGVAALGDGCVRYIVLSE